MNWWIWKLNRTIETKRSFAVIYRLYVLASFTGSDGLVIWGTRWQYCRWRTPDRFIDSRGHCVRPAIVSIPGFLFCRFPKNSFESSPHPPPTFCIIMNLMFSRFCIDWIIEQLVTVYTLNLIGYPFRNIINKYKLMKRKLFFIVAASAVSLKNLKLNMIFRQMSLLFLEHSVVKKILFRDIPNIVTCVCCL